MKNMIRFLIVSLFLTGCMDTAIRLWNSGPYMSQKEHKLYNQCRAAVTNSMPPEPSSYKEKQEWQLEHRKRFSKCVQNKES